jgi:hypothetical protein
MSIDVVFLVESVSFLPVKRCEREERRRVSAYSII